MDTWYVNDKSFQLQRLLGKGKGGYSYLVTGGGQQYVLKQIHHEPCAYYQFGDKIQSEIRDYQRLRSIGIRMPELLDVDVARERVLKEYIGGDTIYDLFVRGDVLDRHDESVQKLHRRAISRVNAAAQARAFDRIEPLLTQEEADVARRARNAHSRPPKNQNPGDYSRATALEALCGYLYLCGRHERLQQLLGTINQEEQNG